MRPERSLLLRRTAKIARLLFLSVLLLFIFFAVFFHPVLLTCLGYFQGTPLEASASKLRLAVALIHAPRPDGPKAPKIRFVEVSAAAGIAERDVQGVCWGDYDVDGWPDLALTVSRIDARNMFSLIPASSVRLHRNRGDGTFQETGIGAGMTDLIHGWACAWGDLNNDGFPDLAVGTGLRGGDKIYMNNGDGSFFEVSTVLGLKPKNSVTRGLALGDYDGDGWVDLYFGESFDMTRHPAARTMAAVEEGGERGVPNLLLRNRNGRALEDAGAAAGAPIGYERGESYADVFFDADLDFDVDLYVTNDYRPDDFYRNDGGVFQLERRLPSKDRNTSCMGVAVGDFDFNLLPDIACAQTNEDLFFFQESPLRFIDRSRTTGAHWSSYGMWGMGVALADFDNDGDLDWFNANGNVQVFAPQRMVLYQRNERGMLVDVSREANPLFLKPRHGEGVAAADYDRDGDLDLFVGTDDDLGDSLLFRNDTQTGNHWLELQLIGAESNRMAIGASAILPLSDGRRLMRQVVAGSSLYSNDDAVLHFGLGDEGNALSPVVLWPSGHAERFEGLQADRLHRLWEGAGSKARWP